MIDAARTEPDAIRVLLVDDHDLFRTGLANLLEGQQLDVVGQATTGADAIRLAHELAPDVVVMDLNMPGMTGIEATRRIVGASPPARVLVLTISDRDEDVVEAVLAGASGYLTKDASVQDLVRGIEAAAVGEALISPRVAAKVLRQVRANSTSAAIAATLHAELSERELEVLCLVASGHDNAEIARRLHISPKTVKNHISNMLTKLQLENRIQAAVYAVRAGLV